jgi:hypothetical protein
MWRTAAGCPPGLFRAPKRWLKKNVAYPNKAIVLPFSVWKCWGIRWQFSRCSTPSWCSKPHTVIRVCEMLFSIFLPKQVHNLRSQQFCFLKHSETISPNCGVFPRGFVAMWPCEDPIVDPRDLEGFVPWTFEGGVLLRGHNLFTLAKHNMNGWLMW